MKTEEREKAVLEVIEAVCVATVTLCKAHGLGPNDGINVLIHAAAALAFAHSGDATPRELVDRLVRGMTAVAEVQLKKLVN